MLEHRATSTPGEQFYSGFNGRPGDSRSNLGGPQELIEEMMRTRNLRHVQSFPDSWTFFIDGGMYGKSFKFVKEREQSMAAFQPAMQAGLCIPQSKGELVLTRQETMLQSLNILCDDILEIGSTTRSQKSVPKKPTDTAAAALSKLSIKQSDELPQLDLPRLIEDARDQKASMDDDLALLCTESVALAHEVNYWFFSRPELVPDEKGRSLPVHTDKFISGSVLEAVHHTVRAAATWDYMIRLLELLATITDKSRRAIVLQEISNLCHFEYSRTQAMFKRQLSTASSAGSKWFKCISNTYDNGIPRIALKGKPEKLTQENPHLYYLLRLSQSDTTATKAVDWFKKLDEYERTHPGARESMNNREADSHGDLAIIVSFYQSLASVVSMPAFNRKKAQCFITKSGELEAELQGLKPQLDLRDYAAPIDNLLEPGMTDAALNALDIFLVEKTGTKLGFLYQDLINECVASLEAQLKATLARQEKIQADKQTKAAEYVPFPVEAPQAPDARVQARKEKEKTRPVHSSAFEIVPPAQPSATKESETLQSSSTFKVKDATFRVFEALFSSSQARGSVSWYNFESAMADLGFSVLPKFGSVYTFYPPQTMPNQRPLTVHRPHHSQIEGYKLLSYSRRLKRLYGWRQKNFEIA
ncbi:hypothetical protein PFICI_04143 [Pestalotiopsis fici W106-1]|uniref:Ipa protein n=1 Tax=Pestalotiopsis fici (strain W106-1 / CGMCC3.15140) TaxID=1229662 RepID=W3XJ77_PESFW|nr:uncharacterized protein PFICI_04143 [Pestalotiopsis fici W106-1]ETS86118.1 hypothetical protein PFICI_04143 [Pestalotiopsis fici W106-1]